MGLYQALSGVYVPHFIIRLVLIKLSLPAGHFFSFILHRIKSGGVAGGHSI